MIAKNLFMVGHFLEMQSFLILKWYILLPLGIKGLRKENEASNHVK
jgi:hypothetical protein